MTARDSAVAILRSAGLHACSKQADVYCRCDPGQCRDAPPVTVRTRRDTANTADEIAIAARLAAQAVIEWAEYDDAQAGRQAARQLRTILAALPGVIAEIEGE